MVLIPQRLFTDPQVRIILQDGNTCILSKELSKPKINKQGYISNHAISIVLSGEQHIRTYEDQLIKVKAGEALFVPRGMYYVSDLLPSGDNFKSVLFYFDDALIQEFLSTSRVSAFSREEVPDHIKFQQVPAIKLFTESLLHIYQDYRIRNKNFLNLKILELLHLINGQVKEQKLADFLFRLTLPKKRNIKSFMEKNYDKPLKIEDYAYLTGRSLSSFRRDFKAFYDITPQQWIKEKRLTKAVTLFQNKNLSVADVSYQVGYENTSYFIKEFKRKVGLSPKQYQLSLHRNNLDN